MSNTKFLSDDVKKIAGIARIPITDSQAGDLADGFNKTMVVVEELKNVDVSGTTTTSQVTGLENVLREDVVDTSRMFSQEEALANAKRIHNGYFVVDQILED